jgi:predicted nucleotidyltransferase
MRAQAPGQSVLLLLDVVELLAASKVDYAAIGALAAAVHGSVRATIDADALVSASRSTLRRLERELRERGFEAELREGGTDDPIPAMLVVTDRHGNRVDLLAGLRGLDAATYSRAVEVPFQGVSLRVVGREDFIAMKCFAGGPQDLADARVVLSAGGAPLDVDLLRRMTRRYGRHAADALERILVGP